MGFVALLKRWLEAKVAVAERTAAAGAWQQADPRFIEIRRHAIELAPVWRRYYTNPRTFQRASTLKEHMDIFSLAILDDYCSETPGLSTAKPEEIGALLYAAIVLSGTHSEAEVMAEYGGGSTLNRHPHLFSRGD